MKKTIFATVAAFLALWLVGPRPKSPSRVSLEEKIQRALAALLDSQDSASKTRGFLLLLEAIEDASAGTEFAPEFREKIHSAREFCGQNSILDQNGEKALREAYALINAGREFQMPAEISSIEQAVQYGREKFAAALKALKDADMADAAKSLLEVAVMVVTPMEAQRASPGQS
jgi:hypothetical protein